MNILFEIGHPAHVYKFVKTIEVLESKGHTVYIVTKDIPSVTFLLNRFKLNFNVVGVKKDSLLAKVILQIWYNLRCLLIVKQRKIDLMIGCVSVAYITRMTRIPSLLFDDDDDEVEPLLVKHIHPYLSVILSPDALSGNRKRKDTVYYPGYHELAYLHPNTFRPDPNVLNEIGVKPNEPYFIIRFNAFKAHHDVGVEGLSIDSKRKLISMLESKGKVFISNERNVDEEFKKYQLVLSPEKIHSLIYYATMLVGDSQTMTSEAAMLGVPAVKCNSFAGKLSVPNELEEKYQLCYAFHPAEMESFFAKISTLLEEESFVTNNKLRKEKMLADKIDVTKFYVWFIENYPESAIQVKNFGLSDYDNLTN